MLTPELFAAVASCLSKNLEPPALGTALAALAPLLQPAREQHDENYVRPPTAIRRRAKPKPRVRIRARKADGGIRNKPALSPGERARAALQANPDLSMTKLAEIAKCSRSTVIAVRNAMAAEQKKPDPVPSSRPSETAARIDRATKFLQTFWQAVLDPPPTSKPPPNGRGSARMRSIKPAKPSASSPPAPTPADPTSSPGSSPHSRTP